MEYNVTPKILKDDNRDTPQCQIQSNVREW